MPVLCSTGCGTRAILKRPKTGDALCQECFFRAFEEEVHHTITSARLFSSGEYVAVAASGGKDSTVLAYLMKTLNERYNYGLKLVLLSIDEGITGYRDDSLETVKRNEQQYGIPLKILSYEELYGWTMDRIVQQVGRKNNCTFCGVFRRQALDRGAAMLGVDKIVTGHNADDVAETIIMNILRGDVARLQRCCAIETGSDGTLPRSKPFKYTYEKEIVMYAYFKKLDYFSTECVYSPNAYRGHARAYIKDLEKIRPSSIMDIIHSGESFSLQEGVCLPVQSLCVRCGHVSSQAVCKACVLLEGLNKGLPRLGIGKSSKVTQQMKTDPSNLTRSSSLAEQPEIKSSQVQLQRNSDAELITNNVKSSETNGQIGELKELNCDIISNNTLQNVSLRSGLLPNDILMQDFNNTPIVSRKSALLLQGDLELTNPTNVLNFDESLRKLGLPSISSLEKRNLIDLEMCARSNLMESCGENRAAIDTVGISDVSNTSRKMDQRELQMGRSNSVLAEVSVGPDWNDSVVDEMSNGSARSSSVVDEVRNGPDRNNSVIDEVGIGSFSLGATQPNLQSHNTNNITSTSISTSVDVGKVDSTTDVCEMGRRIPKRGVYRNKKKGQKDRIECGLNTDKKIDEGRCEIISRNIEDIASECSGSCSGDCKNRVKKKVMSLRDDPDQVLNDIGISKKDIDF